MNELRLDDGFIVFLPYYLIHKIRVYFYNRMYQLKKEINQKYRYFCEYSEVIKIKGYPKKSSCTKLGGYLVLTLSEYNKNISHKYRNFRDLNRPYKLPNGLFLNFTGVFHNLPSRYYYSSGKYSPNGYKESPKQFLHIKRNAWLKELFYN